MEITIPTALKSLSSAGTAIKELTWPRHSKDLAGEDGAVKENGVARDRGTCLSW